MLLAAGVMPCPVTLTLTLTQSARASARARQPPALSSTVEQRSAMRYTQRLPYRTSSTTSTLLQGCLFHTHTFVRSHEEEGFLFSTARAAVCPGLLGPWELVRCRTLCCPQSSQSVTQSHTQRCTALTHFTHPHGSLGCVEASAALKGRKLTSLQEKKHRRVIVARRGSPQAARAKVMTLHRTAKWTHWGQSPVRPLN